MKSHLSNCRAGGLLVAIDGPSGTGKSSVSRALAMRLGAQYLDTGAMYRVATLHVLRRGIDPKDVDAVVEATSHVPLLVNDDPTSTVILLNGKDVQDKIREPEVTRAVSAIAAIPEVRANLVKLQQTLAASAGRCIVEGRDIGTTVLPQCPLKVYVDARPEVRAQRRFDQDRQAGRRTSYAEVLADVKRRDEADSTRATSPLKPAKDAIVVDTSDLTQAEVIDTLYDLVEQSAQEYERSQPAQHAQYVEGTRADD